MRRPYIALAALIVLIGLAHIPMAQAAIQSFSGPTAGTVVSGQLPQGGTAPGTLFADFTVYVENHGGGPSSCIIFDSAHPSGEDWDLGTPNETCDPPGPGRGIGGEIGQPGENCVAKGNILIVAEDIGDSNRDNLVDDPDDEQGGGKIAFEFNELRTVDYVDLLDIDRETATIELIDGLGPGERLMRVFIEASDLGNNSYQRLQLGEYGPVIRMEVVFSSSGALAEVGYSEPPTPTESTTWGKVKTQYR